MVEPWQEQFLRKHLLPLTYLETAARFFDPLAERLHRECRARKHPLQVALNGSQGSGKSTLCAYLRDALAARHGLRCVDLSLDDFYRTRAEREELAMRVHPLLRTRGVPGTHDIQLLVQTLDSLIGAGSASVPRFNKATDDRVPAAEWEVVAAPVDVVLLEGWCLGARAEAEETLVVPVNALEREEDPDARWRGFINECLRRDYEPVYDRFDLWLMLAAPDFDQVLRWRSEQEAKLRESVGGAGAGLMNDQALSRFVAHFERLTRQCLESLPSRVDVLLKLDKQRTVIAVQSPS
jgi:D-glycerate 3-kinase